MIFKAVSLWLVTGQEASDWGKCPYPYSLEKAAHLNETIPADKLRLYCTTLARLTWKDVADPLDSTWGCRWDLQLQRQDAQTQSFIEIRPDRRELQTFSSIQLYYQPQNCPPWTARLALKISSPRNPRSRILTSSSTRWRVSPHDFPAFPTPAPFSSLNTSRPRPNLNYSPILSIISSSWPVLSLGFSHKISLYHHHHTTTKMKVLATLALLAATATAGPVTKIFSLQTTGASNSSLNGLYLTTKSTGPLNSLAVFTGDASDAASFYLSNGTVRYQAENGRAVGYCTRFRGW